MTKNLILHVMSFKHIIREMIFLKIDKKSMVQINLTFPVEERKAQHIFHGIKQKNTVHSRSHRNIGTTKFMKKPTTKK